MIGLVAPSSSVSNVELKMGVDFLKSHQLEINVHPQCYLKDGVFAGSDLERARAFFDFYMDPKISVIWSARGGYGSLRLLSYLDSFRKQNPVPKAKKLVVGFSDSTALLHYARDKLMTDALQAPMPGIRTFFWQSPKSFLRTKEWIGRGIVEPYRFEKKLTNHNPGSFAAVSGELTGGNLSVLTSLIGTPYFPLLAGKILFIEDIGETYSKLDRMMTQLKLAGALQGVRAIVIGELHECKDAAPMQLKKSISPTKKAANAKAAHLKPLRKVMNQKQAIEWVFAGLGEELNIPIWSGLPVGHGPHGMNPLPLGCQIEIDQSGYFWINRWSWVGA